MVKLYSTNEMLEVLARQVSEEKTFRHLIASPKVIEQVRSKIIELGLPMPPDTARPRKQ